MKSIFKISLLAATVALSVGCQQEEAKTPEAPEAPAAFASEDQKASYAIGASLAQYLSANLEQQEKLGLKLDKKDVLLGVTDVFNGTPRLSEQEIQAALQQLDQRVAEVAQQKMASEANENLASGQAYQEQFAQEDGVKKTDSGLLYKETNKVDGPKPKATDTVVVHYSGTLTDGTKFDSSYDRGQPATFPLDAVIPGWTEGVQLMSVGSKYQFVIPAELAYGSQGNSAIPANSTLVFDVELLDIKDSK